MNNMEKEEKPISKAESPVFLTEAERLKRDIYRPDIEKFRLFTDMLRRNILLKKVNIRHK